MESLGKRSPRDSLVQRMEWVVSSVVAVAEELLAEVQPFEDYL
jgi:hypothetical protein